MQTYFGTKEIKARKMTRQEFAVYTNKPLEEGDIGGGFMGYLVEYVDSPNSNHENHKGYISWSPKDVFIRAYKPDGMLTFGDALVAIKAGKRMQRKGWNGANMFIFLVDGSQFAVTRPPLNVHYPEGTIINYRPHIDLKTADGSIATWSPSGSDALAEDWQEYHEGAKTVVEPVVDTVFTRLVTEKNEIHERLVKLNTFLERGKVACIDIVGTQQYSSLLEQFTHMTNYYNVVNSRIKLLEAIE